MRGIIWEMPQRLYWLSFASETAFLGVAIVEAPNLAGAVDEAMRRGLNPGGQALAVEVPAEHVEQARPYRNRLITDQRELARFGARGDAAENDRLVRERPDVAAVICEKCHQKGCACRSV